MANWHGVARSNYVRVKEHELGIIKTIFDVEVVRDKEDRVALIAGGDGATPRVMVEDLDLGGRAFLDIPDDASDMDTIFLLDCVNLMLEEGEVFVWMEAGFEKARYVTGEAWAIDASGEIIAHRDINEIYESLPDGISPAEY